MAPRTVYATLQDGFQFLSLFDQSLADMGALGIVPCTATGTNNITLSSLPAANAPASSYVNNRCYSFIAPASAAAPVSINIDSLGFKPLYVGAGTTASVTASNFYIVAFVQALNSGGGGFFIIGGSEATSDGPFLNVKDFGALGNNTGNDATAVNAAVSLLVSGGYAGGTVFFPPGNYKTTAGITDQSIGIKFLGASKNGVLINSVSNDIATFTLTGRGSSLESLTVEAYQNVAATNSAVVINAVEPVLRDVLLEGGKYALDIQGGTDGAYYNAACLSSYGAAAVHCNASGQYFNRCKIDAPGNSLPNAATSPFSARANTTSYNLHDVRTSQGFLLACTFAGTSGGGNPTLTNYATTVQDGTVQWQIVAPSTYSAIWFDSNAFVCNATDCDFSGVYTYAVLLSGSSGPQSINLCQCDYTAYLYGINANTGGNLHVRGAGTFSFANTDANSAGIQTGSGWTGDTYISDITVIAAAFGISIQGGTNTTIIGNNIAASTQEAIAVAANISRVKIIGNDLGSSAVWGANANGIVIAPGTGDYFIIEGNNFQGVTSSAITDSSSGTHKSIENPAGTVNYTTSVTTPSLVGGTALTISGGTITLRNPGTATSVVSVGLAGTTGGNLEIAGATTGVTIIQSAASASGTLTAPSATDTLVGRTTTDILLNKSLTGAAIVGGTIDNAPIGGTTPAAATVTTLVGGTSVLVTGQGGVGYAAGSGGAVTQTSNKATAVTLNKVSGEITMNNAALSTATIVSFTMTNTSIAGTDILALNHVSGGTPGAYTLNAQAASGGATINVRNNTAGTLSEAIVLGFVVIKGAIT